MTTFSRRTRAFQHLLYDHTPCASYLYDWLLERYPAGRVQEVFLEDFAETASYTVRHVRNALKELLDEGLVEPVKKFSANIYQLITHDDRTLDLETRKKISENCSSISEKCSSISQIEGSKPDAVVTKNREIVKDNRDTHHNHPVKTVDRKSGSTDWQSPLHRPLIPKAVSESISESLKQDLQRTLQQPLNKNILTALSKSSESRTRDALDSLKEALSTSQIKNPAGWFMTALRKGFKPNQTRHRAHAETASAGIAASTASESITVPDGFQVWFEQALKAGVAIASDHQNGELMIYSQNGAEPFEQAQQTWPLAKLQTLIERSRVVVSSAIPPAPPRIPQEQSSTGQQIYHPSPEAIADEQQRRNAFARLQAKWKLGTQAARKAAMTEAQLWGFEGMFTSE